MYDKDGGRHTFDPFNAGLSDADYQAALKKKGWTATKPSSTTEKAKTTEKTKTTTDASVRKYAYK